MIIITVVFLITVRYLEFRVFLNSFQVQYGVEVKVKQSRYRSGVAQWVPGSQGSQIS